MINVQASTENAEAFDRLNRRLDNEVKNFTAMVKEVTINIIMIINHNVFLTDPHNIWTILGILTTYPMPGERYGPEGGRRVKASLTARKTWSRRLRPQVSSNYSGFVGGDGIGDGIA